MLIASAKIPQREGSISPCMVILWATAQLLVIRICFICLGDEFFFLFLV